MNVLDRLSNNKGTVSSAIGKTIAAEVLEGGRLDIAAECVRLSTYQAQDPALKSVRAGAAKVVELVAEKRPELIAPHLEELIPALSLPEPQTRWMIIRVMGFCAPIDPEVARKAIPYAESYLSAKEGLCIASSADLFLGDLGAVSEQDAKRVFPLLERSMNDAVKNEQDWLLEALFKVLPNLSEAQRRIAAAFAEKWQDSPRKTTQSRAKRILQAANT